MDNMSDNQINQKIGILLRREIEARLITQFKKYLSDYPLAIVPPVVLSSRNKWKFIPSNKNENFGELDANEPVELGPPLGLSPGGK